MVKLYLWLKTPQGLLASWLAFVLSFGATESRKMPLRYAFKSLEKAATVPRVEAPVSGTAPKTNAAF